MAATFNPALAKKEGQIAAAKVRTSGADRGASTVIRNSCEVNGIPSDANYLLLTQVMRNKMRFDGFIVSDWGDIEHLDACCRLASSSEEPLNWHLWLVLI